MTPPSGPDRRRFLSGAGKYGALLVGGSCLGTSAGAWAQANQESIVPPEAGFDVKEKLNMIRIFSAVQRAPGVTRSEVRRKSNIAVLQYGAGVMFELTNIPDNRGPLMMIQNWINDAAFGDAQSMCLPFVERDFVGEYFQAVGETVVITVQGEIAPGPKEQAAAAAAADAAAKAAGQAGPPPRRRRPLLPDWCEPGTDLRLGARQVIAQGTRPLAEKGREKGMFFIKLSPGIPHADQVRLWQGLHEKAIAASSVFAGQIAGFELMQRLPNTPDTQMNACGPSMPVPELVASFWSKTTRGAGQFPVYMRAFREAAGQQKAIDGSASFMVMAEEEEVRQSPSFVR